MNEQSDLLFVVSRKGYSTYFFEQRSRLVRKRLLELLFFTFFIARLSFGVYSNEGTAESGEDVYNLSKAIFASINTVKDYDVRVVHSFSTIPTNPDDIAKCQSRETSNTARIVHDCRTNEVFQMRQTRSRYEASSVKKAVELNRLYICHFNGADARYRQCTNVPNDRKVGRLPLSYLEFCKRDSFFPPHLMCLNFPAIVLTDKSTEEYTDIFIESARERGQLEVFPDGTQRITFTERKNVDKDVYRMVWTVDPVELRFNRFDWTNQTAGVWNATKNGEFAYEDPRFPYLPTKITYSRRTFLSDNTSPKARTLRADEVGTISFDWLAVNAEKPAFPVLEDFGDTAPEWHEYLNPKELRKEVSNDIRK